MKSAMLRNLLHLCLAGIVLLLAHNTSAQAIIQIASDLETSYFVKSDGSLWRGDLAHQLATHNERWQRLMNEYKQHPQSSQVFQQLQEEGKHITSANFEPVDLIVSNGVTAVAMQGEHAFFIKNDGSLWAMGNNQGGSLGDGTFDTPDHPIQIVQSGVRAVACSQSFTIFLKSDGSVWGFGINYYGELGEDVGPDFILHPKQVIGGSVVAIAAGYNYSVFIKRDGSLWGLGNNTLGQLGLGTNVDHTSVPREIVASNVVSAVAGPNHALFIKGDGSLWAMGDNTFGKLGDCTIDWRYRPKQIVSNDVVAVTAGDSGSLFLKKDGSLWGMGINWGSNYGEGIEFQSHCPTQIFAANKSALVARYYYNAQLKTCISIGAGKFNYAMSLAGSASGKTGLGSSSVGLPGYNWITIEQLNNGDVRLTYSGDAGVNYALERSSSLATPTWVSLVTNTAPSGGVLVITNTPDTSINNFWRVRAVR
jgi:hypothetical protein